MTSSATSRPPRTGATIGFMTSEPTPVAQSMGIRPMMATPSVISLGRNRWTAPVMTAWVSSASEAIFARPPRALMASWR